MGTGKSPAVGLASELTRAVHEGELHLEYQAVSCVGSGRWRAAEALLRWTHPRRGRVPPLSFIELLDHPALGALVAGLVLKMATEQAAAWSRQDLEISVSVNIAPAILPASADLVAEALEVSGLAPALLTIEVTERASPLGERATRQALVALARLGVRLSLDDFGVGEAGLSRLQLTRFDEIKIDRSFIARVDTDHTDHTICRFLVELAHGLGSEVVAEGVERDGLLDVAADLGVDLAQGFAIHRPEAPEKLGPRLGRTTRTGPGEGGTEEADGALDLRDGAGRPAATSRLSAGRRRTAPPR